MRSAPHLLAFALAFAAFALVAPAAAQTPPEGIDATVDLAPGEAPAIVAPAGLARANETAEARWSLDLALTKDYTTFEIRAEGLDLDHPRELVPMLALPEDEYPLFEEFPHERIWEVDGPARVFRALGPPDDVVLRLGIPGPANVTLLLTIDREPPTYELGQPQNVTPIGFYLETRTNELALADLQVRELGATEWIPNPTTIHHFLQRFPVQGLDANKEHEARVIFTDWAQNRVTTPVFVVWTAPEPTVPKPTVRGLTPVPNSTVEAGAAVTVLASIRSEGSPVEREGVRLFFDLTEVAPELVEYDGAQVRYTPPLPLAPGLHRVSVEARNLAGGQSDARWSFEVSAPRETPVVALASVAALAFAAFVRSAQRRS